MCCIILIAQKQNQVPGISVTKQNQILLEEMQALVFHKQFVKFIWPICEDNGKRVTQQQHAWSIRSFSLGYSQLKKTFRIVSWSISQTAGVYGEYILRWVYTVWEFEWLSYLLCTNHMSEHVCKGYYSFQWKKSIPNRCANELGWVLADLSSIGDQAAFPSVRTILLGITV